MQSDSSDSPAGARHDPFGAMREPNYRFFAFAFVASSMGLQMLSTAIGWEIFEKTGDPLDLVRSIARRVRTNEYKRQQFPPTLRVSDRAWVGRAYPIAQRFFE